MLGQGITNCLDPFIEIAVLENKAVKFVVEMLRILRKRLKAAEGVDRLFKRITELTLFLIELPCRFEVVHAEAWSGALDLIV